MAAPKGNKFSKGRPKGIPNKVNAELKDMIRNALEKAGGEKYLVRQAEENPTAFMTLLGKILPKDLVVSGDEDNPIITEVIVRHVKPNNRPTE